jgi:hypothetical protein
MDAGIAGAAMTDDISLRALATLPAVAAARALPIDPGEHTARGGTSR